MNKKILFSVLGVVGSIASIIALFLAFQGTPKNQAINISGNSNSLKTNQISNVQGNVTITTPSEANAKGQFNVPTNLYGLTYHEARKKLLKTGWIPNERHWLHGDTVDVKSGNGPDFWNKGYYELDSCSGTGYAYCKFEFFDPSKRRLVVITQGEEYEDGPHAKVARVYFEE